MHLAAEHECLLEKQAYDSLNDAPTQLWGGETTLLNAF